VGKNNHTNKEQKKKRKKKRRVAEVRELGWKDGWGWTDKDRAATLTHIEYI